MGMNFQAGIKNYRNFPLNSTVYDMKYFNPNTVKETVNDLAFMNYSGRSVAGNFTTDLSTLNTCDQHAKDTNDFYNGGNMRSLMTSWIRNTEKLKGYKSKITFQKLKDDVVKYNDHLEEAKRTVCANQLKQCISNFNAARHVKTEEWTESKTVTVCGQRVEYTITHPATYWYIPVDQWYNKNGKHVESLAALIKNYESQSGISFLDPSDWEKKISRKDDGNF